MSCVGTKTNPPEPNMHEYLYAGLEHKNNREYRKLIREKETPEYKEMVKRIEKIVFTMQSISDLYVENLIDRKEYFAWRCQLNNMITKENNKHIRRFKED
jgi:uncharacterized protein YqgQ